jgi:hypothetical protein
LAIGRGVEHEVVGVVLAGLAGQHPRAFHVPGLELRIGDAGGRVAAVDGDVEILALDQEVLLLGGALEAEVACALGVDRAGGDQLRAVDAQFGRSLTVTA